MDRQVDGWRGDKVQYSKAERVLRDKRHDPSLPTTRKGQKWEEMPMWVLKSIDVGI